MAPSGDYPLSSEVLELLLERDLDAVPELSRLVLDVVMQGEREQNLGAAAYEPTEARRGHANRHPRPIASSEPQLKSCPSTGA